MENPNEKPHDEAELRRGKLRLESKLLAGQLDRCWLEYAKVFAGPIAVLFGVIVTIFVAVGQLDESRQLREEERFDRAVSRLGAPTATERLAGLAGLQLFLEPREKARHQATVHFLVDALASEQDSTVRAAILDSLSQVTSKEVSQNILNGTLERLRDRDRDLFSHLRATFLERLKQNSRLIREKGNDEVGIGPVREEDLAPLRATASAIVALTRNGARTSDLSGIYCEGCDFSGKVMDMTRSDFAQVSDFSRTDNLSTLNLSGTNFHGSILKNANFIGLILRGASFDSADIIHANFSGADLTGAKFTDSDHRESLIQSAVIVGYLYAAIFPDFTCANLTGADFTDSPFFGIYRNRPNSVFAAYPILHNANLLEAKLARVKVFAAAPATWNASSLPIGNLASFPFQNYEEVGSYSNLPVKNWFNEPNIISVFTTGANFQVKEPVRPDDWASMCLVFSNLASARNLDKSDISLSLKEFIHRHQRDFSRSPHPTPCKPRG
jgi:uncharacterized protein YjbI with pentapeptide repeats